MTGTRCNMVFLHEKRWGPRMLKMQISSCIFMGLFFAWICPVGLLFSHTQQYLNILIFDIIKAEVNGWLALSTIAPFFLVNLLSCSHIGSNGITLSQAHDVVPKGGSQQTISTQPSGSFAISSMQSPLIRPINYPSPFCSLWLKLRLRALSSELSSNRIFTCMSWHFDSQRTHIKFIAIIPSVVYCNSFISTPISYFLLTVYANMPLSI